MRDKIKVTLGATLFIACAPVSATEIGEIETIILNCQACHNNSQSDSVKLEGLQEKYIITQLKDFRSGRREHGLMTVLGRNLSDSQITALAKYYAHMSK